MPLPHISEGYLVTMSRNAISSIAALALAAAGLVTAVTAPASADPNEGKCNRNNNSVKKLLECVTLKGVMDHQRALQEIADDNGGTRASGTPGYDASVDYVEERMRRAGYDVTVQPFDFYQWAEEGPSELRQVSPNPVTYVEDVDFAATPHSEPGDVTAPVTAVDVQLGLGNTSTSGCESSRLRRLPGGQHRAHPARHLHVRDQGGERRCRGRHGRVVLQPGQHGGTRSAGHPRGHARQRLHRRDSRAGRDVPAGRPAGRHPGLVMRLFANVSRVKSVTYNVLAESRSGDPSNVVMAGAHLDSVPEGPGINDNGSGSSALLETAEQMAKFRPANKVRFAWWGAEEGGLVGSTFYVNNLVTNAPAQLDAIEMYLNFDMVGSPNYGLFRYDGDGSDFGTAGPDGSDEIEALFTHYYEQVRHVPTEASPFNGRSDYQAFIANGVPAGGLFTGAEGTEDPGPGRQVGRDSGSAVRPLLPRCVRHHRQPQPGGARHQRRRRRLRDLPVRVRAGGAERLMRRGSARDSAPGRPALPGFMRSFAESGRTPAYDRAGSTRPATSPSVIRPPSVLGAE